MLLYSSKQSGEDLSEPLMIAEEEAKWALLVCPFFTGVTSCGLLF